MAVSSPEKKLKIMMPKATLGVGGKGVAPSTVNTFICPLLYHSMGQTDYEITGVLLPICLQSILTSESLFVKFCTIICKKSRNKFVRVQMLSSDSNVTM